MDVAVVGGGPAGRAVASACSDLGMRVALIDAAPQRVWPHTYAGWYDELPAAVRHAAVATVMDRMRLFGTTAHEWPRQYAVLDNIALWKHFWRADITEVTGKVVAAEHGPAGSTVRLRNGHLINAAVVVDASGASRALSGGRPARMSAQQTAVGVVVDAADAAALCPANAGVFMDWRPAPDTRGGWPTFLYAVRVEPDRVLLKETSLARRPGLPQAQLRRRLRGRLGAVGITVGVDAAEERVRFPLDDPVPRPDRVVPFGAAASLVHPATGYSVAASLRLAPWVAGALKAGLAFGPTAAVKAAWSILWPPSALAAQEMRRRALYGLLALPPYQVAELFELLFALPAGHRSAFLTPDLEPVGTAAAMAALFRSAPWSLRKQLVLGGLWRRRQPALHGLGGT
jgi:lycopene beta-cyclase